MAEFKLVMPKLGESVQEATITRWIVKPGEVVQEDDAQSRVVRKHPLDLEGTVEQGPVVRGTFLHDAGDRICGQT